MHPVHLGFSTRRLLLQVWAIIDRVFIIQTRTFNKEKLSLSSCKNEGGVKIIRIAYSTFFRYGHFK